MEEVGIELYKAKVLKLISKIAGIKFEDIVRMPEETKLSDIGMESIQFIQLVVEIEKEFSIEINDSDLLFEQSIDIYAVLRLIRKYVRTQYEVKKVLILDCDNVLWTGVAGEEELLLSDQNIAFQNEIIQLYRCGIILCLCSKNLENNIFEAFQSLAMPLQFAHISSYRINHRSKVDNIVEISNELNLSVDSFVFVDDSPYELEFMSRSMPEIETVQANYADLEFINKVKRLFDGTMPTHIDRAKLYREQKEREKEKGEQLTVFEYNKLLHTETICAVANICHAKRIAELSQRTNQFNLANRRYTESELEAILKDERYLVTYISAKDKYGDMGIVGACIVQDLVIVSFFLSCRVFGRKFENALLDKVKELLRGAQLTGVYVETQKNKRFSNFYAENGVMQSGRL